MTNLGVPICYSQAVRPWVNGNSPKRGLSFPRNLSKTWSHYLLVFSSQSAVPCNMAKIQMSHREKKSKGHTELLGMRNIAGSGEPRRSGFTPLSYDQLNIIMKQELGQWSQLNSSQPSRNLPVQEELGRVARWSHVGPQKLVASAHFPLESQLEVFFRQNFLTSALQFLQLLANLKTIPNSHKYYCCSFSG